MKKKQETMRPVRTLEAVVKAPGERPHVTMIADTLEAMQSIVGGCIEVVEFTQGNVIICNEEGRLLGLTENTLGICGTLIVLGRGCGDGEFGDVAAPKDTVRLLSGKNGYED